MLAVSASQIVVPLITGLLGGVFGATFTRVTSRNDLRRDRYAEALSALRALEGISAEERATSRELQRVYDLRDWMLIDAKPVGNAFERLVDKAKAGHTATEEEFAIFMNAARAYTRWTIHQRALLHLRTREN